MGEDEYDSLVIIHDLEYGKYGIRESWDSLHALLFAYGGYGFVFGGRIEWQRRAGRQHIA